MMNNLCKSFSKISIVQKPTIVNFANKLNYTTTTTTTATNSANGSSLLNTSIIGSTSIFDKSFEFPIINFNSKQNTGTINLSKDVFSVPLRVDLLHRMVRYQRAKAQQGTHQALNMGRFDKTNRKPTKQKGSGNARRGTNHSILMRGGARSFAPFMRSHAHDLPKKVRQLCLKIALSTKLAQNKLVIIDEFKLQSHKTKELMANIPEEWGRSLLVDSEISDLLSKSSLNVQKIDTQAQVGLSVYTILQNDTLVLTKSSVEALQARLI